MVSDNQLHLVVVTPETTVLSQDVSSLRFALFDGQIGILPGRAPLVGRMGYGELKITDAEGSRSFFVDGGFVQVNGRVVSILTNQAIPVDKIDTADVEQRLADVSKRIPTSDEEFAAKDRDLQRLREMRAIGRRF